MPMIDTTGIRPIDRRQPTDSIDRVRRRDEGGGFRPQTNVNLKAAIKDIAATLGKIGAEEKSGIQKMPSEVGEVVKNVLKQALSVESTLGKGIGSTIESQRFSMEQLLLFSRMLSQMGTLAEKGYSMKLSDELQTLMTNFKDLLVAEKGGEVLEPVLVTKAAFELVDAKTAEQLPQALYEILSQLAQVSIGVQQQNPSSEESMQFLKQLVKFFMPRPGVDIPAEEEPKSNQPQRQNTPQKFLDSMLRTFGNRFQSQTQFNQPQAQNQSQPQFNQSQAQNQSQPQFNQPQAQNQSQPQFNQSQAQNQSQTQFNQPQAQNQSQTQFNQPQGQNQSQTQFNQPQAQNQSQIQFNQPQAQNQSQMQFNQPQAQNQSRPQFNQPQTQNQSSMQFNQPQPQNQSQMQFNQPQAQNQSQMQFQNQPQAQNQSQMQFNQPQAQNQSQTQFNQSQGQNQSPTQFNQPQAQNQSQIQFNQPQAQNQSQTQFNQSQGQNQSPTQFNQPQAQNQSPTQFNQSQGQNQSLTQFNQPQGQNQSPTQFNQPQAQNQSQTQFNQSQGQNQSPTQFNQPQAQNQSPTQFNQSQGQNQSLTQFNQPQAQNQSQTQFNQPQAQNQPQMQFNQSQAQNQPQTQFNQPQTQNQSQTQFNQSQAQNQSPTQFNQPQAQNQSQTQFNQPQAQNQPQMQFNQSQAQFNQPQEQLQEAEQGTWSEDFVTRQKEVRGQMKLAKGEMVRQNLLNTPQTIDTMKNLAQFLMRSTQMTPRDAALLQNFVNNSQQMLPELEARHLQNLLRLCQQNVPLTVQQAAVQQNLPDLPRLWAFMQMCDMASIATRLNSKSCKRAGRDVADFAHAMRHAMTSDNSIIQNQRSFQMMMPLYMGDNEKSYPTYLSIYDENERDPDTGEKKKETWIRVCVLTDYIGAAELVFRIYDETKLDMRFYFSRRDVAEEFRNIYLDDLKNSINQSQLNVGEVRVGGGSERMFSY